MAEHICLLVEKGLTLKQIGEEIGCDDSTVLRRATFCPEAAQRYASARVFVAEVLASRLLDVSRDATPMDYGAKRLYVDTLKWDLSKRLPKVYGERQVVEHAGRVEVKTNDLSPEEYDLVKQMVMKDI